ncbi:hypothetical protein [Sphingomonas sp. PAMC 26617]|uniref:hypothetical protein n=1 Tax=Sphingomonas sp. PAMC 26617 TaxID=1112216 RepID=UPI000311B565|nr:hypothetical protein [Sphingomonas sp. PAMC 26617]
MQADQPDEPRATIPCAHGQASYTRTCTIEQVQARDGLLLTVRHPDGAFRRLLVPRDGRGVIAADGAQQAVVRAFGSDEIEVALGADRYRIPATIKGAKPAA